MKFKLHPKIFVFPGNDSTFLNQEAKKQNTGSFKTVLHKTVEYSSRGTWACFQTNLDSNPVLTLRKYVTLAEFIRPML